ncbi:MAG: hypothetical protein KDN19_18455 [Verrucomicrobiae bacterium]|nr:hypothetical protein [Verrucomicrobiae bacterium]
MAKFPEIQEIVREFPWSKEQVALDSPIFLSPGRSFDEDWVDHLRLFHSTGIDGEVWLGRQRDSGWPSKSIHFRHPADWLSEAEPIPYLPLTTPAFFAAGSYSRSNRNVIARPFLVIEHDRLGHKESLALYRYLREVKQLNLRAIIDTAGKSLHAWFDQPSPTHLQELQPLLDAWGFDGQMKAASQPCRMAGAIRLKDYDDLTDEHWEDNFVGWQHLLFLNL